MPRSFSPDHLYFSDHSPHDPAGGPYETAPSDSEEQVAAESPEEAAKPKEEPVDTRLERPAQPHHKPALTPPAETLEPSSYLAPQAEDAETGPSGLTPHTFDTEGGTTFPPSPASVTTDITGTTNLWPSQGLPKPAEELADTAETIEPGPTPARPISQDVLGAADFPARPDDAKGREETETEREGAAAIPIEYPQAHKLEPNDTTIAHDPHSPVPPELPPVPDAATPETAPHEPSEISPPDADDQEVFILEELDSLPADSLSAPHREPVPEGEIKSEPIRAIIDPDQAIINPTLDMPAPLALVEQGEMPFDIILKQALDAPKNIVYITGYVTTEHGPLQYGILTQPLELGSDQPHYQTTIQDLTSYANISTDLLPNSGTLFFHVNANRQDGTEVPELTGGAGFNYVNAVIQHHTEQGHAVKRLQPDFSPPEIAIIAAADDPFDAALQTESGQLCKRLGYPRISSLSLTPEQPGAKASVTAVFRKPSVPNR